MDMKKERYILLKKKVTKGVCKRTISQNKLRDCEKKGLT